MSLVVAGGYIVVGDSGTYQPWDSTLSQNPSAGSQDNRGCAPGWAAIYVQDSLTGNLVRVCRKLDQTILGPSGAQVIREEASPDWYDQSIINVASGAEQVVQGGGVVLGAAGNVLGDALRILGPWIAVAALGYLLIVAPRRN